MINSQSPRETTIAPFMTSLPTISLSSLNHASSDPWSITKRSTMVLRMTLLKLVSIAAPTAYTSWTPALWVCRTFVVPRRLLLQQGELFLRWRLQLLDFRVKVFLLAHQHSWLPSSLIDYSETTLIGSKTDLDKSKKLLQFERQPPLPGKLNQMENLLMKIYNSDRAY